MFYLNCGHGFSSSKEYKSLGGAKRAASSILKTRPIVWGRGGGEVITIGERQNGRVECIVRVYRWGYDNVS